MYVWGDRLYYRLILLEGWFRYVFPQMLFLLSTIFASTESADRCSRLYVPGQYPIICLPSSVYASCISPAPTQTKRKAGPWCGVYILTRVNHLGSRQHHQTNSPDKPRRKTRCQRCIERIIRKCRPHLEIKALATRDLQILISDLKYSS